MKSGRPARRLAMAGPEGLRSPRHPSGQVSLPRASVPGAKRGSQELSGIFEPAVVCGAMGVTVAMTC